MIGIVDYKAGNLTSVKRALSYLALPCKITNHINILNKCDKIIFPGVGAAGKAMENLKDAKLDIWLRGAFKNGLPILGICLGTQVIFEYSEEDNATCIGLLNGTVKHFPDSLFNEKSGNMLKIPHMGWNRVSLLKEHPVFQGIPSETEFYFVHSYYPVPYDPNIVLGETEYGITFCSIIGKKNLIAVQFHPEKSGRIGLEILKNFSKWDGNNA